MMSRMAYSEISVTTPAPTVRPPSRIANRSSRSIAIGTISSIAIVTLSPGITISTPLGNVHTPVPSFVRKSNCGRYPLNNGVCRPPSSFASTYTSALNFLCGVIDPGFANTCPRSTSSLSTPRNSAPMLSPAPPPSSSFRNISTPVTTDFPLSPNPPIPISSPTFPLPPPTLTPHLPDPAPYPPRHPRPPPRDRENVLDRHQKRLVHRPRRRRNVTVHRLHQLPDALRRRRILRLLHRPQRTPPHHRDLVPRKLILLQQLPHLQLHQIQNLRVVHHVALVHEHHQTRHIHLPRQQHVLPRLRHRPIIRRHHEDRPVHLRRPRDHVLDVVRVPRTIDVRIVPVRRLVLHVAHRNRDPPLPLLRRIVDRPKIPHRHPAVLRLQHLRDRTRQRRLAVINVPDRPDVHVRLRPIKLLLGHDSVSSDRG